MNNNEEIIREYSNGEVVVVWKPALCTHAKFCWQELPEVFDPNKRPWVNIHGAPSDRIIAQVERCPSGALTYKDLRAGAVETKSSTKAATVSGPVSVQYVKGAPLLVKGDLKVELPGGRTEMKTGMTAFCRCGKSKNQPYCDGAHQEIGFND